MLNVEIFTEGDVTLPYSGLTSDYITDLASQILLYNKLDNVSVTFILTDDGYMKTVNREFRNKDTATDVISFAYRDEPFPSVPGVLEELGDIYISLEKASVQSVEYGVTFINEIKRLVIHGLVHLLGYDHERSPEDERIMTELEDEIIQATDHKAV